MLSQDQIMSSIEAYLNANPNAADTADGIMKWWVKPETSDVQSVSLALSNLEERGTVERVQVGNRTLFRKRRGE